MLNKKQVLAAVTATVLSATASHAATLTVESFSTDTYNSFVSSMNSSVVEDFESYADGEVSSPFASAVGSFSSIASQGNGSTVVGTGENIAVRNEGDGTFRGGRVNTTDAGAQYLDSNDTLGIVWDATLGGSVFNRLAFSISDAADVGARLEIFVNGEKLGEFMNQDNGTVDWVTISLDGFVESAQIELRNSKLNDGFSLDDIVLAAIPLPATGLMLLAGLGGLGLMRRRK